MNISTHKHTLNITKSPITLQKCGLKKKKTKIRELGYIHNEETLSTSMGQISNNAEQEKNPFYHKKRKKKKKKERYGRVYILLSAQSSSLRTPALC